MKRLLVLGLLALSGCGPTNVNVEPGAVVIQALRDPSPAAQASPTPEPVSSPSPTPVPSPSPSQSPTPAVPLTLMITPSQVTGLRRQPIQFTATGGQPPYLWSIQSGRSTGPNPDPGSITANGYYDGNAVDMNNATVVLKDSFGTLLWAPIQFVN